MATIRDGKISTTFKYVKVRNVPELALGAVDREYSDGSYQPTVSGSSVTSGAEERRQISRAEECFITKRPGFYLKKAHWVNAVRKNVWLKKNVENFLLKLGIVILDFSLDSPSNITPMDRNLHYALNKLGFFAVTCSKSVLQNLISLVHDENVIWQERASQRRHYIRRFNHRQPPLSDATYELVLLYPDHFLPKGSAITVFTEDGNSLSGKMYVVSPDGALREGRENDKAILPAFMSNNARTEPHHTLNPFLVVINAEIAFRRFKRCTSPPTLCPEYMELIELTLKLVDEIYFQPLVKLILSRAIDNLGTGKRRNKDKTIAQGATRSKGSRMGTVVKDPGPGAPHDKVVEYELYKMSGCDLYDDDEGEDDDEADNGHGDIHGAAFMSPPIRVFEKVQQWRTEV